MEFINVIVCLVLLVILSSIHAGEDFYSLLGVDKGASVKEIRKAFKKLAILKHPDKNVEDAGAHDVFIKINRAYEVLKDEDLRKKYDQHGEEGLKDNFQQGRRYESWQWYQQNFEQSVEGTREPWFINFYSTHCSHCHDLAPTREKYQGERSTEALVERALQNVKAEYHKIGSDNFEFLIKSCESSLPWLITFCGDDGDCLEKKTCIKLAAMLAGLVNVGRVNCHQEGKLCSKLDQGHGTFFYPDSSINTNSRLELTSLYARDIATAVLEQLPDVEIIRQETLQNIHDKNRETTWLIHFVNQNGKQDLELRKLPALLKQYRVGRADCSEMQQLCQKLHVNKFPSFILYKARGGVEVYYGGRVTAHDIAAFVHDSADNPLENLGPADFPDRVVHSKDPWFVDFFAPWCPPCMRLLPEFKKASKFYGSKVNFGTVDCTVHGNLCNLYNIHSYPTTIFYNQSIPYQYHGQHRMQDMLDFITDTLNPRVISLDQASFQEQVYNKGTDDIWLVDFFAPWCGPCQQLSPEWRKVAKKFKDKSTVHVAQVDCEVNKPLCRSQNVHSYPTIRLYPAGSTGSGIHYAYSGWHRDATSIEAWVYNYLPSKVTTLTGRNFHSLVLDSQQPWIVDFYAPWCGHCQVFKPEFENVAESLEGIANAGKVDCDAEPGICNQAGVGAYPSVRMYTGAENGNRQNAYGWDIDSQNADYIIRFVKNNLPREIKRKDEL
ncbi:unnamed protein product [Candidula unifasciata]|uniref:DnaJ homolog subfamily C member 10 n=1 Tax=Candidula unifasciata TaxID=100452 RepID=A0A8S3YX80_9EUPU|nr:unnamed protein product [Candidula unifasciata]